MKKLHILLLAGLGVATVANAQSKFNFQAIDLPQDSQVLSVNSNGAVLALQPGATKLQIWTPQKGLSSITYLPGDVYREAISDSSKVYGESQGSIIQFDLNAGHRTLLARNAYKYSIVDSSQDNLLIRAKRESRVLYYTYKSGTLSRPMALPTGFTPTTIGADGVVRGNQPAGFNAYGEPQQVVAKLNSNGTSSVDPNAVFQFGMNNGTTSSSVSQTIGSLIDGTVVSVQMIGNGSEHSSNTRRQVDVYFPNGSHSQFVANLYESTASGLSPSGSRFMLALKDGRSFGYGYTDPFDYLYQEGSWADHVAPSTGTGWVSISDPSILTSSSIVPDQVVGGSFNGVLVGANKVNGHLVYSLSFPPKNPLSHFLQNRS